MGDAHVDRSDNKTPKLCLHYEPTVLRITQVEALAKNAGAQISEKVAHLSMQVEGIQHERQSKLKEENLVKLPGVLHAAVSFGAKRMYIEFDPSVTDRAKLIEGAKAHGLRVVDEKNAEHDGHDDGHDHKHGGVFGENTELIFSILCGVLTAAGFALGKLNDQSQYPFYMFVSAYFLGGWFPVKEAFESLRGRTFEIDFLMLLAAAGAAVLGEWFEGALLLFLFTLGHALEGYAMSRARKSIEALGKLAPKTALRLIENDKYVEVTIEELVVGDRILIKPNSRISADGFVVSGTSSVDQAPVTGESVPVEKMAVSDPIAAAKNPVALTSEQRVFAGTINGSGALTVIVTKLASDSTLARIVKMVSEAETQKSPTQMFTDRFERRFVPVILIGVVILLFACLVIDESFSQSFYRAMAVLVAASPCALAIATPSAVLAGVARAAKSGVLIKGGAHLESLGTVKIIAFDKTGTLTEGKPKLTDTFAADGVSADELLSVAFAVESSSDHPLASAITTGAKEKLGATPSLTATDVKAIIGFGIEGKINGDHVLVGKPGLFLKDSKLPEDIEKAVSELLNNGRTVMIVKRGDRFLGTLGVMDTPRAVASDVLKRLHALGIEKTLMLTGDNKLVGEAVARQIGLTEVHGDLLPEEKVAILTKLASSKSKVAMVGDGVNDAPAMAHATVGIAMGAGGSDVALETADVALMADDLTALPFAVGLSRAANRIIRQNLWASLGMVAFLIPATVFGFAKIGVAVALHEGSTLLVVANALRLLAYSDD